MCVRRLERRRFARELTVLRVPILKVEERLRKLIFEGNSTRQLKLVDARRQGRDLRPEEFQLVGRVGHFGYVIATRPQRIVSQSGKCHA